MGRQEEALQDLDQADRLQPNDAFTLKFHGATKRAMGRHEEALQDLDQADRLQPNDAFTLTLCGATKLAMDRLEEALQDLDKADRLRPNDAFTLLMRGAVQWKRGQLPAALRDLEKALRLYGDDDGDVLALRAVVKLELGDPEGARQDALRARDALSGLPPLCHLPWSPALCQDVLGRSEVLLLGGGEPSPQQTQAAGGEPSPQQTLAGGGEPSPQQTLAGGGEPSPHQSPAAGGSISPAIAAQHLPDGRLEVREDVDRMNCYNHMNRRRLWIAIIAIIAIILMGCLLLPNDA
eukprot:jgi/Botrbrau1/18656/Bobra.0493s0002.1